MSKLNPVRYCFCKIFLVCGILALGFFCYREGCQKIVGLLGRYFMQIIWCVGWSSIGISLGLYNSRTDLNSVSVKKMHYVTYFLFVWFTAFLSALALSPTDNPSKFYAVSALIGIAVGFKGDKLAGGIGPGVADDK